MDEARRERIVGKAVTVRGNDIDTDRIIPARFLRCVVFEGLGEHAFEDDRALMAERGQTHPFDKPAFQNAGILFANKNFGCGSSREHAPQALMRWNRGLEAVVGESFSEIFSGNCVALGIPPCAVSEADIERLMTANEAAPDTVFTVDVAELKISWDGGEAPFSLPAGARWQFLEGRWDSTTELRMGLDEVDTVAAGLPYFRHWK